MSLPRWVDARWNTRGRMRLILSCTRVLVVGVTSIERERERERERVWPCSSSLVPSVSSPSLPSFSPRKALDLPFYRYKERVQMYNGGCSYVLTWLAEKCLSPVYVLTWPLEKCLSPVEAQLAVRQGSC
jgi:hypothetical protein